MDDRILVKLPEWAICAIEYDDYSALDNVDTWIVTNWLESIHKDGYILDIGDTESYFSSCPEFGMPCEVVDCYLVKMNEV